VITVAYSNYTKRGKMWSNRRTSPVMRELHWLPVRQRLKFKTAVLVFKCIHGQAPVYLSEYCKSTTDNTYHSHLRSANMCHCACCLFHSHGQPMATGASPSVDQTCGTVYLWHCGQV